MYNNNTGKFHFTSLLGCVCFFILYQYKSNAILATPIKNMEDATIFAAYKDWFEYLEPRGYKPKLNIINN